eukprot:GHVU01226685.1.p1 GENE.GHVU01226685.1~~GHVU01226685.1.p1  ORF type:complete len:128 (+),score=0.88 GHVU01226685.1:117-500(+)
MDPGRSFMPDAATDGRSFDPPCSEEQETERSSDNPPVASITAAIAIRCTGAMQDQDAHSPVDISVDLAATGPTAACLPSSRHILVARLSERLIYYMCSPLVTRGMTRGPHAVGGPRTHVCVCTCVRV